VTNSITATAPNVILVMGVSGTGKSTIGRQLATALSASFIEGDDHHPPANVAHMAAGHPLTDEMRWPWLDALITACQDAGRADQPVVLTCSALKRSYRDHLRAGFGPMTIVFLDGGKDLLARRMSERSGHFMPPALLESQLATLEPPTDEETTIHVHVSHTVPEIIEQVLTSLPA
jgi:gluconokinase